MSHTSKCLVTYVHVPDEKIPKLDPKVEKCIFIDISSKDLDVSTLPLKSYK
jgi:hypothetical protein